MLVRMQTNSGGGGGSNGACYCIFLSHQANDYYVTSPSELVAYWAYNDYSYVGTDIVDDDNIKITYSSYTNFSITFKKACTYTNENRQQTSYNANDTLAIAATSSYCNTFEFA